MSTGIISQDQETPLLSIAIPTLNRANLLETTLKKIIEQSLNLPAKVEIIVSDNASDDGTSALFTETNSYSKFVRYIRHEKRVNIDESFARTVQLSQGKFILLFGDDDIPLPGLVREICESAIEYPDAGFIYINRIIGDSKLNNTTEVPHADTPFGRELMPIGQFIERFTHWPCFVSCLVFSAEAWRRGQHAVEHQYPGVDFLGKIYWGCKEQTACYIAAPLVLQRRGVQTWKKEWPRYWLLSMPRLLTDMDKAKISKDALRSWIKHETTTKRFVIDCFVAKAYKYSVNDPFWKTSRAFQSSPLRKIFSYMIQYALPSFIAEIIYNNSHKKT